MPDSNAEVSPQTEPGPAPAGEGAEPVLPAPDRERAGRSRNILLFSDGTGNSSAKIQKTNVWRLYEALDLGYPVADATFPEQIAYYDNGVGTSAFKPLAALGGVFGFGLARNVRNIYKFLCRNYRDASVNSDGQADRIYAFGFSRGAYTIRLLVALICSLGIVRGLDEGKLDLAARDVWSQARQAYHTNNAATDLLVCFGRWFWRSAKRAKRFALRQPSNTRFAREPRLSWIGEWRHHWWGSASERSARRDNAAAIPGLEPVAVEFVGVWDTVAAYGGPIVEITRAIDTWIWPLTMPHYQLHPSVKTARHALAIDDKRDAFHPLLWDEVDWEEKAHAALEAEAIAQGCALDDAASATLLDDFRDRLQQVWFAGMHSDVGGGYADESLSYVSLYWMIEHAEVAGLRLLGEFRERFKQVRNIYGPIHDSRAGVGAFYRYQPRYINAWLDNEPRLWTTHYPESAIVSRVQPATEIFRDPTVDHGRYRDRGLLLAPIRIHWSVKQRLGEATDGYGPNNLPGNFHVDKGIDGSGPLTGPQNAQAREETRVGELLLGDRIKLRRFWYFSTIVLVVLLAARPLWPHLWLLENLGGKIDVRTDAHLIESAVAAVLPKMLGDWLHTLFADLFTSLVLLGLIGATMAFGVAQERAMVDISRRLWRARLHGETPSVERPKGAERLTHAVARYVHRSDEVQAILAHIKWKTLPFWLGFAMWLTIAYAVVTGVTQLWLARVESRPGTCPGYRTPELVVAGRVLERRVNIDDPCTDLGWALQPGKAYRVEVELTAAPGGGVVEWRDAGSLDNTDEESQAATPDGWVDPTRGAQAIKGVAKFSQRVVTIPLMTPVFELRRRALIPGERPNPWWFCNADATSAWCDKRAWRRFLLGDTIHMFRANLRPLDRAGAANLWGGTITAPPVDSRVYSKLRGSPPRGTEPALHRSGHLFVFANDAVIPFDQRGVRPGCPKVSLGIRILDLCGAYSGNRGSYLMRIWLLDGSPREQAIDRQLRRRCQQFTDRQRCLTVFAREPPPN